MGWEIEPEMKMWSKKTNTSAISAACAAGQELSREKLLRKTLYKLAGDSSTIVSVCGWMPRTPKEWKHRSAPAQNHFAELFGIANLKTYRWNGRDFQPSRHCLTKRCAPERA
jgi:hypothetical protein